MMNQIESKILTNEPICSNFFKMEFSWDPTMPVPLPGQFLTIRVTLDSVPLLRRPFAFSGYDAARGCAAIIYQKKGRATDLLTALDPGESIDVIGPLGKGFSMPEEPTESLLVAGGVGLGPILFLAATLRLQKLPFVFLFGCRTASFSPEISAFSGMDPIICTDDGSAGFKGTTVDYLNEHFPAKKNGAVYCCGPAPMLKGCHEFAKTNGLLCWVSVEQIMACGVGACMGCAVKIIRAPGYARACIDGPVFDASDLLWEEGRSA